MMGYPMSLEQSRQVTEAVEKRKAAVAASLGKTAEELGHDDRTAGSAHDLPRDPDPNDAPQDQADTPCVDEEQVLAFIRNREKKIEALEAQVRTLKLDNARLAARLDQSERKVEALRTNLMAVRTELAERKAAHSEADAPQA